MVRIGIVGSRRRDSKDDKLKIETNLAWYLREKGIQMSKVKIISGGCPKGGDRFAEEIASECGFKIRIFYPDKSKLDKVLLKKNPRAAYAQINYARNTLIANSSDVLIACVASDRKGGTEDTIKKFVKRRGNDFLILV
jgi:hypothetical protein